MTLLHSGKHFYALCLVIFLNACTGIAIKEEGPGNRTAYQDRAVRIVAAEQWSLVGKISLDDGDQGGSGRLQWDVGPDSSELDFHGAFGRGAWHLQIGPQTVLLEMADGTRQETADIDELIQDRLGWPIPLDALQWWVRGLAAPGAVDSETLGPAGELIGLSQYGWQVDFSRYDSHEGVALPVRLEATSDNFRVKLAIKQWKMDWGNDTPE